MAERLQISHLQIEAQRCAEANQPAPDFWIVGPKGIMRAKWSDPHFGFIDLDDGTDALVMVRQLERAPADIFYARTEEEARAKQQALAELADLLAGHD